MAVRLWAAGSALAGTATTLGLVAPTLNANDIMIAQIASEDNDAHLAPDADWTAINEVNNGTGLRSSIWWKRAAAADSGATFTFTSFAGTTGNFGVIVAYRGCTVIGSPIGSSTNSTNASADNVTYATLTPLSNESAIVACGFYADDATTAETVSGTTPVFDTTDVDVETATGSGVGLSLFQSIARRNVGGATGALTQASASVTDAVNNGMLFELLNEFPIVSVNRGEAGVTYPRRVRQGNR